MDSMSQFIEMFGDAEKKPFVDVCINKGEYGSNSPADDYDGNIRYVRITDITEEGNLNSLVVSPRKVEEKYMLLRDDLLFARTGNTVGKTYLHRSGRMIFAGYLIRYRLNNKLMLPQFAFAYTHTNQYYDWVEKIKKVGAQPNISAAQYDSMPIPVPSMAKQIEFVSIAKQADKSKFGDFKSQFIEMFGDCVNRIKLSSLCSTFVDGDWIESKDQSELGIRLIQTGNVGNGFFKDKEDKSRYISEETFDNLHCTEIYPGDILVSRLPDPIGRACIIPQGLGRTITAVDCTIIRLKDIILPDYFIAYTMTPSYVAQINEVTTGTTRRRVSRANLGNILIPCPSIAKQQQFVAIAKQADKSKSYVRIAFKNLESMLGYCIRQIS